MCTQHESLTHSSAIEEDAAAAAAEEEEQQQKDVVLLDVDTASSDVPRRMSGLDSLKADLCKFRAKRVNKR